MSVLQGLKVLQVGPGLGAAVCGRCCGCRCRCKLLCPEGTHRSLNISTMENFR